jgi:hypothetical protein
MASKKLVNTSMNTSMVAASPPIRPKAPVFWKFDFVM